jgi:hypothetical protein
MSLPVIPQANSNAVAVFAIPETVWTPISKQVGLVILASPFASIAAVDQPDFPKLETACQLWVSTTFPGLVGLSSAIATFAATAATRLSKLGRSVSQQTQAGAVSRATAELVTTGFAALAKQAAPLNTQCNALYRQVQVFRTEFEVVDAEEQATDRGVQNSIDLLGPWEPLIGVLPPVEQEAGLVMGAWQAITDDFNAVTAAVIQSMDPFLLPLELNEAARSWTNLAPEAAGFASLAQGQQQYLSGAWLNL